MGEMIRGVLARLGKAALAEVLRPIEEVRQGQRALNTRMARMEADVRELRECAPAALECDLSLMDDRICHLIGVCMERGYTTAEERRRIGRMHEAYRARGGNHGEESEYARFCRLPAEEEWRRSHGN